MRGRKRKRAIIVMIAALIMVMLAGVFTLQASAATLTAGKSGVSQSGTLGKSADGTYFYNALGQRQWIMQIKVGGSSHMGYCAETEKSWYSGNSYKVKNHTASSIYTGLSDARKRTLALVLFYGYHPGKAAPSGNQYDYYAATQVLVWEAVKGAGTVSASGKWSVSTTKYQSLLKGHSYAKKCYNAIRADISKHLKGASFTKGTSSAAKTYRLKYHYKTKKWSVILTDTGKGNPLKKMKTTSGLTVGRNGYQYTFSASKAGTYSAVLANNKSSGTAQPFLICHPTNTSMQAVALGAVDTTRFYVKFKTETTGTARIKKTSEDGKVDGFVFRIRCAENGYDAKVTTDTSGLIAKSLYPGTYTVTEVLSAAQKAAGYKAPKEQKLVVVSGKTATVTMHNTRQTGNVKLLKTSDTGVVKGFRFQIVSSDGKYQKTVVTDEEGLIAEKLYPGTYRVTESLTDAQIKAGYLAAEPQTFTVKAGETVTVKVHNRHQPQRSGIQIRKQTSDGGPVAGFRFRMTGVHNNAKVISEKDIADLARPVVSNMDDYALGNWTVEHGHLKAINDAAAAGDTGTFHLTLKNTAARKAEKSGESGNVQKMDASEAVDLKITVQAELRSVRETSAAGKAVSTGNVSFKNIVWAGSATRHESQGVTDRSGMISQGELEPGTYTVTEVLTEKQALRYHKPRSRTVELLKGGDTGTVIFRNEAKSTDVRIVKTCSDGNIAGIEFTIAGKTAWGESLGPVQAVTDEQGVIMKSLPAGSYTVAETGLDADRYLPQPAKKITITGEETEPVQLDFQNVPYAEVEISKKDSETKEELPGAILQLLEAKTKTVVDEWRSTGPRIIGKLIHGTEYVLHEKTAPAGYAAAADIRFIAGKDRKIEMMDAPTTLFIAKLDGDTKEFLPGAVFEIVDAQTQEKIVEFEIAKKEDGQAVAVVREAEMEERKATESDPEQNRDAHFSRALSMLPDHGEGNDDSAEEVLSSSMYGRISGLLEGKTYLLRETEAPEGYTPGDDVTFTFRDGMRIEVENRKPAIRTMAFDSETKKHLARADDHVAIVDVVMYSNLRPGGEYTSRAVLMDKSTNQPLICDGGEIRAEKTFTAETRNGTVEIQLPAFDGSKLANREIVVFESLMYHGQEVARHTDINDAEQTIVLKGQIPAATVKGGTAATGDPTRIWIPVLLQMAGILCIGGLVRKKRTSGRKK